MPTGEALSGPQGKAKEKADEAGGGEQSRVSRVIDAVQHDRIAVTYHQMFLFTCPARILALSNGGKKTDNRTHKEERDQSHGEKTTYYYGGPGRKSRTWPLLTLKGIKTHPSTVGVILRVYRVSTDQTTKDRSQMKELRVGGY